VRSRFSMIIAGALTALALVAVPTASATTVEECQDKLTTLIDHTVAAEGSFTNPDKDHVNLVDKLEAATAKLEVGKNADAVQKLVNYRTTLNLLATADKPKVDFAVAEALRAEAADVISCIEMIGA
jgi:hypothetical protein